GSLIGPVTIDSRTLTTNYNVADNATGAQELWVRGGFEWTPLNNVTIKDQVYNWRAKANWLDSETYAFSSTSMSNPCPGSQPTCFPPARFLLTPNQNLVPYTTLFPSHTTISGTETCFADSLKASRNWIAFVEEGNPNDFPFDTVSVVNPIPGIYGPE